MPLTEQQDLKIYEGNSFSITFTLEDDDGTDLTLSSIDSATLTYYDLLSDEIQNSREDQNVLNANQVTITDGSLVWSGQAADANIQGTLSPGMLEAHVAKFTIVYSSSTKRLVHNQLIYIEAIHRE